jgi:ribosomal protein S17
MSEQAQEQEQKTERKTNTRTLAGRVTSNKMQKTVPC